MTASDFWNGRHRQAGHIGLGGRLSFLRLAITITVAEHRESKLAPGKRPAAFQETAEIGEDHERPSGATTP
jgi:hypothetical protein